MRTLFLSLAILFFFILFCSGLVVEGVEMLSKGDANGNLALIIGLPPIALSLVNVGVAVFKIFRLERVNDSETTF